MRWPYLGHLLYMAQLPTTKGPRCGAQLLQYVEAKVALLAPLTKLSSKTEPWK
jgi:hypothetical protein